jgi:predicted RND superfamily exporter protein
VIGTVMAFAVAELAFGYVNSSTAFLGSIILGNGINYAIILMSRYEEYRAAGDRRSQPWNAPLLASREEPASPPSAHRRPTRP